MPSSQKDMKHLCAGMDCGPRLWASLVVSFCSMVTHVFLELHEPNQESESESESEVTQSCLTLCNPVDCSPPGSSIHGILQARVLEWVAISFSRGSSQPRDRTQVSCIAGRHFNLWATREAEPNQTKPNQDPAIKSPLLFVSPIWASLVAKTSEWYI